MSEYPKAKSTVLTPTYNRIHLLPRLYGSLLAQTSKNFEWLIVDDGSTDSTEQVVQSWIKENKLMIKYMKKENGGKHTALNLGVKSIETELIFLLDSDDYLVENAIERVYFYFEKHKSTKNICGITFHRINSNGKISGGHFPEKEQIASYPEFQVNTWHGDTAQIFYSSILSEFPFPEFKGGKKCVSEDIVWIPMGLKYKTVYVSEALTVSEYQKDGLTRNSRKVLNYRAQYEIGLLYLNPILKLKYHLRGALMVNVYNRFLQNKMNHNKNIFIILMYLPGLAVYKIWKWKHKMENENEN
jgi:glycosyltransferase involved in cell wall biosynthesis